MRRALLSPLLLVAVASGCSSWGNGQPLDAVPMPADPATRYEVWSKGEHWEMHALRIDGDTLRGVRWWHEASCDSCQIALARSNVDSIRTQVHDGGKTGAMTLFLLPFVAFAILWVAVTTGGGLD
jgi:hypothetical protein